MCAIRYTAFKIVLACLLFAFATNSHAQQVDKQNLSNEQKLWGLMQIWGETKYNFAYFDKVPNLNWDSEVQKAIPTILAAKSTKEYYFELRKLIAKLNDGHTQIMPPGAMSGEYDNPPLEFQFIEGKIIVVRLGATEETKKYNLTTGMELIAIDDILVSDYFAKNVENVLGGTKQYRQSFGLFLLLNGASNSKVKLKLKNKSEKIIEVELTRNSMANRFSQRIFSVNPLVETKMMDDGIVCIKLSSFQADNIVVDFSNELKKLDLSKIKGMILDLRYNFGGNSQNGDSIISHLIEKPLAKMMWKSRKNISADKAWGKPEEWVIGKPDSIKPNDGNKYNGPLVVLTGPLTFSAAEDFLIPLKHSKRALLVGEKTAGSTGQPIWITLPGGGLFSVCSIKDFYPDGKEFVGIGIEPDVVVHPTLVDIYEDKVGAIIKAIEVIKELSNKQPK